MKTISLDPRGRGGDLAAVLRAQLRAARRRNPRFSLRSLAARLGIHHSTLSQVVRGKRQLTRSQATAVRRYLGMPAVAEPAAATSRSRIDGRKKLRSSRQFAPDTFELLSAWPHSAILELTHVAGFEPDARWIAHALDLPVSDVNVALQRLLRLRLLKMADRDRWVDTSGDASFRASRLSAGLARRLRRQAHDLAIDRFESGDTERQVSAQMVFAMSSAQLPAMRKLCDRFLGELQELAAAAKKDDVFHVGVSMFPLTTLSTRKRGEHE